MGSNFLEEFSAILPHSQQEKLYNLLAVDPYTGSTEQELEAIVKEMLDKIGKQEPVMKLRVQGEQTDSSSYNQTLREILTDLSSLYLESNLIDSIIVNNHKLNVSILDSVKEDIKRLERKIDSLNLIADNTDGYSSASREDFDNESKMEKATEDNEPLFTDKNGSLISSKLSAYIEKSTSSLELGTINEDYDRLHVNGNTVAEIDIVEQAGQGFQFNNPEYTIDKAIDNEMGSFWGEVVLTDEPIKVPIDGISGGAICKFVITLPAPASISEFIINPYIEYPIEILSIAYSSNDQGITSGYLKEYKPGEPTIIDGVYKYSFPSVIAKSITVTIRQQHASRQTYIVSRDQVNNKELWSKVSAIEANMAIESDWHLKEDGINPAVTQDMVEDMDSTWQVYLKKNKQSKGIWGWMRDYKLGLLGRLTYKWFGPNLDNVREPRRVYVDKFEYIYGAYDIQLYGKEYHHVGIYVSKPYKFNGNVQQVVLEAEEEHPKFYFGDELLTKKRYVDGTLRDTGEPIRRTSVEYYVTASPNPDSNSWRPILPLGQDRVYQELLVFDTGVSSSKGSEVMPRAKLCFEVNTSDQSNFPFTVYKNEVPLIYGDDWQFSSDDSGKSSNKYIAILQKQWDPNAYFTIDYYPAGNPWTVDFTEGEIETFTETEYFLGTDKNCAIKLSHYPFVNRKELIKDRNNGTYNYNPLRVTLNPSEMSEIASRIFNMQNFDKSAFKINGRNGAITSPIQSSINPSFHGQSGARLLNVTNYFDRVSPTLNSYNPKDQTPTFEYVHEDNRVYLTETFKHDGPAENYETSHGNAIIKVEYDYLVSGVRAKIILRRTSGMDNSVSPKVNWYAVKCKSLV